MLRAAVWGALGAAVCADRSDDWLVTPVKDPARVTMDGTDIVLSNGLATRRFATQPAFGTVDLRLNAHRRYGGEQTAFRTVKPEGYVTLNGTVYTIGGLGQQDSFLGYCNRTALKLTAADPATAFTYLSHTVTTPSAPFPWTPGTRGSPAHAAWPPRGATLVVTFAPPTAAPASLQLTMYYELYEGAPLMTKWFTLTSTEAKVSVDKATVEVLGVGAQWGGYIGTHGAEGPGSDIAGSAVGGSVQPLLHAMTDQAHSAQCSFMDDFPNGQPNIPGCPTCHDEGSTEPYLNCSYTLGPGARVKKTTSFESFKVYLLLADSAEIERYSLAKHRATQLLAPHVMENPIFFHGTDSSELGVKTALDQMAEVGFDMFIFSFGSGFNYESEDIFYLEKLKRLVAYGRARGIELGGYDLIVWTRNTPAKYIAEGKGDSLCIASGWYDELLARVTHTMNVTGMSMIETDGPYPGYTCTSHEHKYHEGEFDSIYRATEKQNQFYKEMRGMNVYVNQPDNYFFQGANRAAIGYDEQQFSLSRWRDLTVTRQGVYDDLYKFLPTQGWTQVPLVQYHAGGAAAMFQGHVTEYEWALAQNLGAGVAACYRGEKPYTSDAEKAILKKWIGFYKAHRETVLQPVVHMKRATGQDWDGFVHVNPLSSTKEVAVAMLFNPTHSAVETTVSVPVYYAGLDATAAVSVNGAAAQVLPVQRDYTIDLPVHFPPVSIFTVVISTP